MKKRMAAASLVLGTFALGVVVFAGDKATTAEAQALLDKAVKMVETEGSTKAIAAFNDPKGGFVDRDLYVFCYGPDGKITAHRDPALVGNPIAGVKDADGKEIGKEMAALGTKGGSLEYKWKNPVSNKVETKVSYLKKAGDQVCGVGAYK
jgi:cytochrome c